MPGAAINRDRGVPFPLQPPSSFFQHCPILVMFPLPFCDRPPDGVAWLFYAFGARGMLASGRGRPEWACAPSLRLSGISKRALGPWGPAPAMSHSLKGDGDA